MVWVHSIPSVIVDITGHFVLRSFLIGLAVSTIVGAIVGGVSYVASELISYGSSIGMFVLGVMDATGTNDSMANGLANMYGR